MIALTQAYIDSLIDFNSQCIDLMEGLGNGNSELCLTHKIALGVLTAKPEMYVNCIKHCDSWGPEVERRAYPDLLSAIKSKEDHGGVILELFIKPPVPEVKFPELRCYAEPHTQYGEGVVDGYNRCLAEIKRLNGWGE